MYAVPDLMASYELYSLIGDRCKPPDHSLIKIKVCLSEGVTPATMLSSEDHQDYNSASKQETRKNKRYYFDQISDDFLCSDRWIHTLDTLMNKLESTQLAQSEVDALYDDLCSGILTEMDRCIKYSDSNKKTRKTAIDALPYQY